MSELTAQVVANFQVRDEALAFLRDFKEEGMRKFFSSGEASENTQERFSELWTLVNKKNFNDMVEQSEKEIKALPIVTVYTPVEMVGRSAQEVVRCLKENFSADYLVDFKLDLSLIAGCALVWQGKYGDFSVKKKMAEQRENIKKIVLSQ